MNKTDAQGFNEEPSAKAQEEALKDAETTGKVVIDDGIAAFSTAEQGDTAEPSAAAQDAMLDE